MLDNFKDIFDDAHEFCRRLNKNMFKDIKATEEAIRSGKLEGELDIKPIEEPRVKGYIAQGRLQL